MKQIKINNENSDIFIKRLKSMSRYAFLNYIDEKENNLVVDEFSIETPKGIIYIKKTEEKFGAIISFLNDIKDESLQKDLYELLMGYFQGKFPNNLVLTVNGYNKELTSYFLKKRFSHIYSAYGLVYNSINPFKYDGDNLLFKEYAQGQEEEYINLLGRAFFGMREELGLKPYNWYEENRQESLKYFAYHKELSNIKGLWKDGALIGVTIIDDNEIEMLAIDEAMQGKGYGERVLRYCMNEIINVKKHKQIFVAVMQINKRAVSLYKKHGFKEFSKLSYLRKQ